MASPVTLSSAQDLPLFESHWIGAGLVGYLAGMGPPVAVRFALDRAPEMARRITGARYAALVVMNERGDGLEHFFTAGVDEDTRRQIGHPPRGRGVLGDLILDARALRLADVRRHPNSYGVPPGHPVMRSFLGVPIMIGRQSWGSLHLAEKPDGEFTQADEDAIVSLAQEASNTIRFERRYQRKATVARSSIRQ